MSKIDDLIAETTGVVAALKTGEAMGERHGAPRTVDDAEAHPYAIMPSNTVRLTSLERYLEKPLAIRQTVTLRNAPSFAAYVARFQDAGTIIFVDKAACAIAAVLDYHAAADEPRWGRHRAKLTAQKTPQWQRWMGANKQHMNQSDFAQFLEDNIPDIADPPAAGLVEAARNLEATKNAAFASSVRPHDGSITFNYSETIQQSTRNGTVKVPEMFTLALAPFEGSNKFRVDARLRFRIEASRLTMWFDLYRLEDILDAAFAEIVTEVEEGVADATLFVAGADPGAQSPTE